MSAYKYSDKNIDTSTKQAWRLEGPKLCDCELRGASITVCMLIWALIIGDHYLLTAFTQKTVKCSVTPCVETRPECSTWSRLHQGRKYVISQCVTYTWEYISRPGTVRCLIYLIRYAVYTGWEQPIQFRAGSFRAITWTPFQVQSNAKALWQYLRQQLFVFVLVCSNVRHISSILSPLKGFLRVFSHVH